MGMESCVGKTVMAGVMGGGLGAMFGLFMASVCPLRYLHDAIEIRYGIREGTQD